MDCLHCGAKLNKSDIFCLECETPVVTEDDITLMPNAEITKFVNEAHYSNPDPHVSDAVLVTPISDSPASDFPAMESDTIVKTDILDGIADNEEDEAFQKGDTLIAGLDLDIDQPQVKRSRKSFIITIILIGVILLGGGLFLFSRLSDRNHNDDGFDAPAIDSGDIIDPDDPDTGVTDDPDEDDFFDEDPEDLLPVSSIILLTDDRVQLEFHTMVGESVLLYARLVPEGSMADVTWRSSDPDVLEVIAYDQSGRIATITGKAAGVADIIVSADNFEINYVVFVDSLPLHVQLESAIDDPTIPIWLTISWTGGDRLGQDIVFERDGDTQLWTLESAIERGGIDPIFGQETNAFTIRFPTESLTYFFYADGMGSFMNPDGSNSEEFFWWFKTTLIEAEG